MTFHYRIHGLNVCSDLELPAPAAPPDRRVPDLTVYQGPVTPIPTDPPPGRLMAETVNPDGSRFCSTASSGGTVVLRFHGLCEFRFSPAFDSVEWRLHPGVPAEVAAVMAAGGMMSVALILKGHLVLHASAVAVGAQAVAFVGRSGMGKSTLATLSCLAGCRLVTDDLLRVDGDACYQGSTESRLRSSAGPLAETLDAPASRRTVDGRLGVALAPAGEDRLSLRAVVVPQLDRQSRQVSAERVKPLPATLLLSQFPRVLGWTDPATAATQFQLLADAASTVPVWVCRIPWPPTPPTLVPDLFSAVGVGLRG